MYSIKVEKEHYCEVTFSQKDLVYTLTLYYGGGVVLYPGLNLRQA